MYDKIDTIIIGGTFNPVHYGHIYLIHEVESRFNPKSIFIIPSYISSHKKDEAVLSEIHRLEMLKLATKNENVVVEDCEIKRKGVSYSIDTVRFLKEKYAIIERPGLVIGDDLIHDFDTWKNAYELSLEALLIIAARNKKHLINDKYEHIFLRNNVKKVSSTEIRASLKSGKSCKELLPDEVYDYIKKNRLYGAS